MSETLIILLHLTHSFCLYWHLYFAGNAILVYPMMYLSLKHLFDETLIRNFKSKELSFK
ncbi:hypothetical protein OIU74_028602 [Salix koriyanagi]|uniref:Uncharacterized protein n=1 Tax=Salix koriyanagi TaxID=2511006 RepID=A0A9Q0VCD0_9ROSI|nr:hypothetical protein OIU74_028602 [Salix koriyanagi]